MFKFKEVGIDLGSNSIKIARIDKTGSTSSLNPTLSQLKDYKTYPVNCEPYTAEYYQLLKSCIKDFSKTYKLFKLSLNITIPVDNVHSHINFIDMPIVSEKVLSEGVELEAEQKMAMEGITDSRFTWKIIKEDTGLEEYRILLVNLKKDIVKALTQFKTIKWRINRVMLQPVVLERIAESNDIVLDMGHSSTRVYLYVDGKLAQVEVIDIGGKDVLNDVKNYLEENSIKDISAEDILKQVPMYNETLGDDVFDRDLDKENFADYDLFEDENDGDVLFLDESHYEEETNDDDIKDLEKEMFIEENEDEEVETVNEFLENNDLQDIETKDENFEDVKDVEDETYDPELIKELSLAIDGKVKRIIEEVKGIVRMFELQAGSSVDSIFYVGQLSNLKFLKESIEAELELELKPVDILDINDEQNDNVTLYSLASLVSMDAELKDDTNFTKFIKANIDYSSIIVIALTLSLSVGFTFKVIDDKYTERISELSAIEAEQSQTISNLQRDIDVAQESIDKNNDFIQKINMLKAQKKWLSDILYVIPERTPLTIVIKDLSIKDGTVVLGGYSSDYSSIGFFANKLEDIAEVNIDSIEERDNPEVIYSVTMDNPELISDKYIVKHSFQITLKYQDTLLEH
jgi:hypothetical protein